MEIQKLFEENARIKNENIQLKKEVQRLQKILNDHHIPYTYQPMKKTYNLADARFLNSFFKGRDDVYAKRIESVKGVYYAPQCHNFWKENCPKLRKQKIKCSVCTYKAFKTISPDVYIDHLNGKATYGIYPLRSDNKTFLIVFDFDDHDNSKEDYANKDNKWQDEVTVLRKICEKEHVPCLVERSRSGHGAHVWFIFDQAISATLARKFGSELLTRGAHYIDLQEFKTYDRMLPMQDYLLDNQIGNLIALPLQGQSVLEGNTCFVDENWEPYCNQWEYLRNYPKISVSFVEEKVKEWGVNGVLGPLYDDLLAYQPWNQENFFDAKDIIGDMRITLADGIYIDKTNIKPPLRNTLRRMAAFKNSQYNSYIGKNKRMYYLNRIIDTHHEGDDYIKIPRGLLDQLQKECDQANIKLVINDQRNIGRKVSISFKETLTDRQEFALKKMLNHDMGILNCAPGFGKTVVACALIAKRQVSTLVIVANETLLMQWQKSMELFLDIHEEPPTYMTPGGRIKHYKSCIGTLKGGTNKLTGLIDIAMIQSIKNKTYSDLKQYGMVIMDECHHCAEGHNEDVLSRINARYVYGLTATVERSDGLTPLITMTFGPVRYEYLAFARALEQNFSHTIYPRFTRVINTDDHELSLQEATDIIKLNDARQEMICDDVIHAVSINHTPIIISKYIDQCKDFYDRLKNKADHVFILIGKQSKKEREMILEQLKSIDDNQTIILIATIQLLGEGFDFPRANTIMLASPISFSGRTTQIIGRITRDYKDKRSSIVYDYIDVHIPVLERMYHKRLTTYRKDGFMVVSNQYVPQTGFQSFYDSGNFFSVLKDDIRSAKHNIIFMSPSLSKKAINLYLETFRTSMENGISITVYCLDSNACKKNQIEYQQDAINLLIKEGINIKAENNLDLRSCIIDDDVIWYGDINLLNDPFPDQVVLRYKDSRAASELLELVEDCNS